MQSECKSECKILEDTCNAKNEIFQNVTILRPIICTKSASTNGM